MTPFAVRRSSAVWRLVASALSVFLGVVAASAQPRQRATSLSGVPAVALPDGPVVLYSADQPRIRVVPITTGLSHPWGLAFLRNGDILVTERNRWEFLLTAAPLPIWGGTGSPINPIVTF